MILTYYEKNLITETIDNFLANKFYNENFNDSNRDR